MYPFSQEELYETLCQRHSKEVQERLKAGKVAIAGLGGLGSNVAIFLARIGVGHLHLIDFDRVDLSNLNRQQYTLSDVGQYKTDALLAHLMEINPYLKYKTSRLKVTASIVPQLFAEETIICEAFDDPVAKAMLTEEVLLHLKDTYLVCASGLAGYDSSNAIQTRQKGKHLYLCGDETSQVRQGHGLMAPRAALCASHEANMIVRLLLGETSP